MEDVTSQLLAVEDATKVSSELCSKNSHKAPQVAWRSRHSEVRLVFEYKQYLLVFEYKQYLLVVIAVAEWNDEEAQYRSC